MNGRPTSLSDRHHNRDNTSEEGLAGVETLALVTLVMLFFVTGIFAIVRVGLTKLSLMDAASARSRSLVLALASDPSGENLSQQYQTQNWLGEAVTVSVLGSATSCSMITVRAETVVELLPWSLLGGAASVRISATSTTPTDAYLIPGGGFSCAS